MFSSVKFGVLRNHIYRYRFTLRAM